MFSILLANEYRCNLKFGSWSFDVSRMFNATCFYFHYKYRIHLIFIHCLVINLKLENEDIDMSHFQQSQWNVKGKENNEKETQFPPLLYF